MYQSNERRGSRKILRPLAGVSLALVLATSGLTLSAIGAGAAPAENVAAAKAFLASYVAKPSAFPFGATLKKLPKRGTVIDYLSQGDPTTVAEYDVMKPGAKLLGFNLKLVETGATASTIGPALDSVVATKPAGVIVAGVDPEFFPTQLAALKKEGVKVVGLFLADAHKYGIRLQVGSPATSVLVGKIEAAWTIAKGNGNVSNIVYYNVPEFTFLAAQELGIKEELTALCPGCTLREDNIDISAIGSTAPQDVVSDLQANPSTQAAIFPADLVESGLPTALQQANIKIPTIGYGPTSSEVNAIQAGQEPAAIGFDQPVSGWGLLDVMARALTGQKLVGLEATGIVDLQVLTSTNLAGHIVGGLWTGYPDYVSLFKTSWGLK